MTKRIGILWLLFLALPLSGQVTVNVSSTVKLANAPRPGIDLGPLGYYSTQQFTKDLLYPSGGNLPSFYGRYTFSCNSGGPAPTTTNWFSQPSGPQAFHANYFAGATYTAYSTATGFSIGSGTISANTSSNTGDYGSWVASGTVALNKLILVTVSGNQYIFKATTGGTSGTGTPAWSATLGSTATDGSVVWTNQGLIGISFTLSGTLSSACASNDLLVVNRTAVDTSFTPAQFTGNPWGCTNCTYNTTDVAPGSTNPYHSLQMSSGGSYTLYTDAVLANYTNTNPTLAAQQVPALNLNGSYTLKFWYKCNAASGTATVTYNLQRQGSTTYANGTLTPTCNSTSGAGWTQYTNTFTASENGAQTTNILFIAGCTAGTCLFNDFQLVEGSTLTGNTTIFRDAVVRKIQALHPGFIRFMDSSLWCSSVADETYTGGGVPRWCGSNPYSSYAGNGPPTAYTDDLNLCLVVGTNCYLSVSNVSQPSEWTSLVNWLSTQGFTSAFASAGLQIYLADGNESWNTQATPFLWTGNGLVYGSLLGPNMAAARAASGYNGSVVKLVGNSWYSANQSYGPFGWIGNTLANAHLTANGLPDFAEIGPYNFNYVGAFNTSGGNVVTSGTPWPDMFAEIANFDSVSTTSSVTSVNETTAWLAANYPTVKTMVYESGYSDTFGIAMTQTQADQITASVGSALVLMEHELLMVRDAGVTGPLGVFNLSEPATGYNCSGTGCVAGVAVPIWGIERTMACGPGQLSTCTDYDRPPSILEQVINGAIGSKKNLLTVTQTSTPTYSYAGGQPNTGTNTIVANPAVNYVNCTAYGDTSSNVALLCFNNDQTSSHTVTITGLVPTGTVTQTAFPAAGNLITDHNENTYLGASSIAPLVTIPSPTTASGTTYTLPASSMLALSYAAGGAPASFTGSALSTGTALRGAVIQ